ncbi:MAG: hypothetical protein JWP98_950, partial [Edaphobacter sp.]|nr:hypothetical protein [Edaphobacter sp.]
KTMKVAQTIDVPSGPSEVIVSDDGKSAYVACNFADQVAMIDLKTMKVVRLIDAGKFTDGLGWAR